MSVDERFSFLAAGRCVLGRTEPMDDHKFAYLFYSSVAVLVAVAAAYFIARAVSASWRTKAVRSYFSPYICGAIIWITLIVLLSSLYNFSG